MTLALPYKVVWISTPPRTGSMWLLNVTRQILAHAGRAVLPEEIPQSDEQMLNLASRQAFRDTDPGRVWVLKVHRLLWADLPRSRLITCIRDPRDVLVSFRRFMNSTFDEALAACEDIIKYSDAYRNYPADVLLRIDYVDIEQRPAEVAAGVARFLDVTVPTADLDLIVENLSRDKVRKRIEETTARLLRQVDSGGSIRPAAVVVEGKTVVRVYDAATGFQTGHVSDNPSGSWRALLSDEEKGAVHARLGDWLLRNGYPQD